MNIIDGKRIKMLQLGPSESIPEEYIKFEQGMMLVHQHDTVWNLTNSPMHSVLSKFKTDNVNEFVEKTFGKIKYDPKMVYLLADRWKEFKISKEDFNYVKRYFQKIYDTHKTEAAVVLMLNPNTKSWKILFVPQVWSAGGQVNYLIPKSKDDDIPQKSKHYYECVFENNHAKELMEKSLADMHKMLDEGYCVYGTIHSHCDFKAFHSGVDDADEIDFPGLHITIGNVRSKWSFSARYMLNGASFPIDTHEVVDIKDQNELKEEVDNIEIDNYHFSLMMPELGKPKYVVNNWFNNDHNNTRNHYSPYNNHGFGKAKKKDRRHPYQFVQSQGNWWDEDNDDNYDSQLFNKACESSAKTESEEYDQNVKLAANCAFVYDIENNDILVIDYMYYLNNRHKFPRAYYMPVDDLEPTPEMIRKHKAFEKSEKKNKNEDMKLEKTNRISIFDNPNLNPSNPSKMFVHTANEVQIDSKGKK